MVYELVNRLTANSVAAFSSEEEACAARDEFARSDPAFAETLAVVEMDDDDERPEIVEGSWLREWAEQRWWSSLPRARSTHRRA